MATADQPLHRPSITATITRGECRGSSVTVDRDELVDLIRRLRGRRGDGTIDPGAFTIGRQPLGDNHLFVGNADGTISNVHLLVMPIEEDAVRISHQGRAGTITIVAGTSNDSLQPGEERSFVLPIDVMLGNPASTITIRHADPYPTIDDGANAWDQLTPAVRLQDNRVVADGAGAGFAAVCASIKERFAADLVVIADRDAVIAAKGRRIDGADREHLWRWYAFNGRAFRLLRNLTSISLADGCSPDLGHGMVLRLFQGGVYLYVLRRATVFTTTERERLARIAWYLQAINGGHPEWFPRMHLEDCEPMHLRRLVTRLMREEGIVPTQGPGEALQRIAPRINQETGILFPRRSRKPLSANAGMDVPRRHAAVAQASQNRYYQRLTDLLELFVTDLAWGVAPTEE